MSSIHEVAKQAGVSTATVSRTFSSPDLINEQTQKRVLEVAKRLNYQPRRQRTLAARTLSPITDAIGFQFFAAEATDTLSSNHFYAPVLSGAQAEAASLGLHLLLHTTDRRSLRQEIPKMILERAVGGMLLVGTADPAILETFSHHVPNIVLVDNRDETGAYESVVSDGFGGAFTATRYLQELGHRRIAFYLGEPDVATFRDRLRGYLCAQFEAGHLPVQDWIVGSGDPKADRKRLAALLTGPEAPTAVLAANDDVHALIVLNLCRELGLNIPGDLSLVGFDDVPITQLTTPPLTTVRVNTEYMGRLAVRRLYARMQVDTPTSETSLSVCHQIPVTLVERNSCRSL